MTSITTTPEWEALRSLASEARLPDLRRAFADDPIGPSGSRSPLEIWSSSMSSPGLGLSLPIVKGLIGAHGGRVRVVNHENMNGLEFTLPAMPTAGDHRQQTPRSELSTMTTGVWH